MKKLSTGLLSVTKELQTLAQKTAELASAIEKITEGISAPVKQQASPKPVEKSAQPATPTDHVLKISNFRLGNCINKV